MNAIYLEPNQVPAVLRGGYTGKKFKVVVCTETTIPADAGLWSGGTRDHYSAIDLNGDQRAAIPGQHASPWESTRRERSIAIKPGFVLVRHSMFCGKDHGLTFYIHPSNAAKLLPPPAEALSDHESIVLNATCAFKSSYNGRDRYDMAKRNARTDWSIFPEVPGFPSRVEWQMAKDSLIAKGLLNKAGAVTTKGRNARPLRY